MLKKTAFRMGKIISSLSLTTLFFFTSCSHNKTDDKIIIWTNDYSIVSYVELFNYTHTDIKAVAVYKESPSRSLPPANDEAVPDIIIGPWLKNSSTRKYFTPLDYMFEDSSLSKGRFYSQLIDYGTINEKQYLLPLSFNVPAIVFSAKHEDLIDSEHILTLEQIRDISKGFNQKNKAESYTAMGYAPSWDSNFIYLTSKLFNTSYSEKGKSFSYNSSALDSSIEFIKDWTKDSNTSTTDESNFQFKYLYMPKYRQVSTERCLFTYLPSNEFFSLTNEQSSGLLFRWISHQDKIMIEDDIMTLGLYKKARHVNQAEKFITWLLDDDNQKAMLERMNKMNIDTKNFGIAGGFSSIKNVNEQVYPTFYRQLLGNVPSSTSLEIPGMLPTRWNGMKERVIIPYLTESTNTENEEEPKSLENRISEWNRQYF